MAERKPKIYIAGPMTGIPQFNFPAFAAAKASLEKWDTAHEFVSPTELDSEDSRTAALMNAEGDPELYRTMTGETWGELLSRDVQVIADEVDGIVVLPGWEKSTGARLEAFVAMSAGKPVYDFDAWYSAPLGKPDLCVEFLIPAVSLAAAFENVGWSGEPLYEKIRRSQKEAAAEFEEGGGYAAPTFYGGEVRTVSATGGEKGVKPERLDLIPPEFLEELGRVFGAGAKKYSDNNYLKGYEWRKSLGAMLRHIMRWSAGEDIDPETGCAHLAHAAWHCSTLYTFQNEDLGTDDRLFRAIEDGV